MCIWKRKYFRQKIFTIGREAGADPGGGEWGETPPQDLWSVGKFHELGQNVTVKFRLRAKKTKKGPRFGKHFGKVFASRQIFEKIF